MLIKIKWIWPVGPSHSLKADACSSTRNKQNPKVRLPSLERPPSLSDISVWSCLFCLQRENTVIVQLALLWQPQNEMHNWLTSEDSTNSPSFLCHARPYSFTTRFPFKWNKWFYLTLFITFPGFFSFMLYVIYIHIWQCRYWDPRR